MFTIHLDYCFGVSYMWGTYINVETKKHILDKSLDKILVFGQTQTNIWTTFPVTDNHQECAR